MRALLAGLLALLIVVSACGGDGSDSTSPDDQAKETAEAFFVAASDRDWGAACKHVKKELATDRLCPEIVKGVFTKNPIEFPETKRVRVTGAKARVEVTASGGDIYIADMKKEGDAWKVDDFGIQPG